MGNTGIDNEYEVVNRLRNGDEQAFNVVYVTYRQQLFYFARRYVHHQTEAEDITAEAFMKLWTRKENFNKLNAIVAFLHKTVKNRCLDYLKHEAVKDNRQSDLIRVLEDTEDSDLTLENIRIELLQKIYAEVENLPPRLKAIFLLSYRDGLKPAQIAEKLNITVQTVKNQRINAVRLLRLAFKNDTLITAVLILLDVNGAACSNGLN